MWEVSPCQSVVLLRGYDWSPRMAAFSFSQNRGHWLGALIDRLGRSRFFTISVALHFVLVLTLGSVVLVKNSIQRTDFDDPGGQLVVPAPPATVDPIQPMTAPSQDVAASATAVSTAPSLTAITTNSAAPAAFSLPAAAPVQMPGIGAREFTNPAANAPKSPTFSGMPLPVAQGIKNFTNAWKSATDSGSGVGKSRAFKFTAYLAKYAGGDWDSTVQIQDNRISMGSLPNLLYIIRKWSSDRIEADADAEPLDLASDEIFTRKPPFIFFTGHEDFVLNAREIENLQKYLQLGGCLWGDSSLPGERSRFDLAFRREMKRVLPDQDIAWETLPENHPLYTQTYFPEIKTAPPGMNAYREPVYALKRFGEVAVIYTANDYGDMWQIGVNERGDYDLRRNEHDGYVAINATLFDNREAYFRGLDAKSVANSYKFGTNIVLHLLTRWEDKLRTVPTGL